MTDLDSFKGVREEVESELQGDGLNLLINNAGVIHRHDLASVTPEVMMDCYKVNTIAPLFIVQVSTANYNTVMIHLSGHVPGRYFWIIEFSDLLNRP